MDKGMQCMLTQAGMHGSRHRSLANAIGRGSSGRISQLGSCMRQLPAEAGSFHVSCAEVRLQLRHLVPHALQLLLQVVLQQSPRSSAHGNARCMAPITSVSAMMPDIFERTGVPDAKIQTLVNLEGLQSAAWTRLHSTLHDW